MPTFACEFCDSKVRVPDQYVGKRVKCPGCGKAITVPGERPDAGGGLDLSLLDDSMSGGEAKAAPRKLRSIAIGCGACEKTIHIPENKLNTVTPCPKCKAPLKVDIATLPDTPGSTIDLKHLSLDPVGEPSLLHDSLSGGALGSVAALTGTGTHTGSRAGSGFVGNAQDQMQELRQLNDLKAEGSISDEEYRRRKAEIYAGGSSSSASMARKAMSRSAGGASDRAIRVNDGPAIPGFLKALIAVGIVFLGVYLVWTYALKPMQDTSTPGGDADPKNTQQADATNTRNRDRDTETTETVEPEPEPEVVTWASRLPELGPGAREVVMVMPGQPGPAPDPPAVSIFEEPEETVAPRQTERPDPPAPPRRPAVASSTPGAKGKIAFWPVMLPDGGDVRLFPRHTDMTKSLAQGNLSATVGVGIGPSVTGHDDLEFQKYQNEIRQALVNTLANDSEFTRSRPDIADRTSRFGELEFFEDSITSDDRRNRIMMLTGIQDGYAVVYWFAGSTSLYRTWQRDAVGNAVIE